MRSIPSGRRPPTTRCRARPSPAALKEGLTSKDGVFVGNKAGDADAALAGAAKKVEAVYENPYWHHVTMEPMNCTAKWTADKCEVWVATQNGEASLAACAEAAGLPPSKCEVYKHHLGGGFGRRGFQDYTTKAVLLAKQIPGVPVKTSGRARRTCARAASGPSGSARWKPGSTTKATWSASRCAFHRNRSWPSRRHNARPRAAWTRSPSRASIPAARKASSATPLPTC